MLARQSWTLTPYFFSKAAMVALASAGGVVE